MNTQVRYDFIVFGLQPWDFEMGSNCKDIANEMAKFHRVLYVNKPIERVNLYKHGNDPKIKTRLESVRSGKQELEKVKENIWVLNPRVILESINWLPASGLYRYLSKRNGKLLAAQISKAQQILGFTNPVIFIDNDFLKAYYLNDFLIYDKLVYYIRDNLRSQPYFAKHGSYMEPGYCKKADIVVANSLYLANYAASYNPHSFDIGQGCELEQYVKDSYDIPSDIAAIPHPRIGYSGNILSWRLDISLLESIADKRPNWNIVLVGPEDETFAQSSLHQMPNVHFLGSKPVDQLPNYVQQFDVCINPQLINEMTIGNYPRKIDEYLALGKPTIATTTQAMELFKDHCILAANVDEYIEGIELLLQKPNALSTAAEKKTFALTHSWENSLNKLYQILQTV